MTESDVERAPCPYCGQLDVVGAFKACSDCAEVVLGLERFAKFENGRALLRETLLAVRDQLEKNDAHPPSRSEVAEALRIAWRGFISGPDGEGEMVSFRLTDAAAKHTVRMLDRLALDPADPRCRVCGKPVDAPGDDACCDLIADAARAARVPE